MLGRRKEAFEIIDRAVKIDTQSAEALYIRGLIKAKYLGERAALSDFEKAASHPRADLSYLKRTVGCAHDLKEYSIERRWLDRLLKQNRDFKSLDFHASHMFHFGDHAALKSDGEAMIKLKPKDELGYVYVVKSFMHSGNVKGGIRAAEQALLAIPNNEQILLLLMQLHQYDRNPSKATEIAKTTVRIYPKNCDAREALAFMLSSQNRLEEAVTQFDIARSIRQPKTIEVLLGRATTYRIAQEFDKAAKDYELLFEKTHSALELKHQAECEIGDGKYAKALQTLSKLTPSDRNKLTKTEQANFLNNESTCFMHLKKYSECRAKATEALLLHPRLIAARITRAQANIKTRNDEEALVDLSEIIKSRPDIGYAYGERAKIYQRQGKASLARKDLLKLNELSSSLESDLITGK
jgi:tetratricopeptide (TPR) repeat protein